VDGDALQEERFSGEAAFLEGLRSALAFPITGGGGPRGVIELLGSEVLHPDEELLYTVGLIGRKIGQFTDRQRAEKELHEAEERLRLATEAGHIGLLDWDVLADESRCSGAMAEIFGYPPGEFNPSYEGFLERVHPDDRARVRRTLDAAIGAGAPHELEFRIVRPAGDVRWVHSKGRVHGDERGTPARVLGVCIDVTEQKKVEQERERLHSLEVGTYAEAAERERISRELHDRVAHSMGVAHQSLQLYEALAEKDPVRARGKLYTAKEMTKTALEQTRNLSMELRRTEIENGLVPALQDLLEVAVPDDVNAVLSTSGAESLLSDHQRGQLYLILREAVRNSVRHSGCRRLTVGLDITSEEVSGYVEDDGSDFEGNG
jgi:PAS domain S-box-containing protein